MDKGKKMTKNELIKLINSIRYLAIELDEAMDTESLVDLAVRLNEILELTDKVNGDRKWPTLIYTSLP